MPTLLFLFVGILAVLFFGGVLALHSMLIGGVVAAFIWWLGVFVGALRERARV